MHGTLLFGLPREVAKSGIAARRKACEYLNEEGFAPQTRFGGFADVFGVGWRSSGLLQLLRLRREQPKAFEEFWTEFRKDEVEDGVFLFKRSFPQYRGRVPVMREDVPDDGFPDDAQLIDEALYECLNKHFKEVFEYSWGLDEEPCVLYHDECGWPETKGEIVGRVWVVVIGYKF
jgi:hypothetical protein